jgi:hypothetical protein
MMREFEHTHGVEKLNYIPLYCWWCIVVDVLLIDCWLIVPTTE